MQARIKTYCHIKDNKVYLNGQLHFESEGTLSIKDFLKAVYKHLNLKYTKFYKMDEISKLGFLASEVVLEHANNERFDESGIGVVLSNSQSTLVTDKVHQVSINDSANYYPSPSVFVYTLPNIMIGEISIKHKFRGENAFYIFEHFNTEFISDYINSLFTDQKINACLGGWVDQSAENYEAFVYWTEIDGKTENAPEHTEEQIKRLYEIILK